jgi:integrase
VLKLRVRGRPRVRRDQGLRRPAGQEARHQSTPGGPVAPAADGRLLAGVRGGELPTITYRRAWAKARQLALTPAEYASSLARRPYDLRHACLSTWLNGGVYPTQVAEWAGHSADVLLRIYAKCVAGQDELTMRQISGALRQD